MSPSEQMHTLLLNIEFNGTREEIIAAIEAVTDLLSFVTPASVQIIPPTAAELSKLEA
jgi:hypothetical protein